MHEDATANPGSVEQEHHSAPGQLGTAHIKVPVYVGSDHVDCPATLRPFDKDWAANSNAIGKQSFPEVSSQDEQASDFRSE